MSREEARGMNRCHRYETTIVPIPVLFTQGINPRPSTPPQLPTFEDLEPLPSSPKLDPADKDHESTPLQTFEALASLSATRGEPFQVRSSLLSIPKEAGPPVEIETVEGAAAEVSPTHGPRAQSLRDVELPQSESLAPEMDQTLNSASEETEESISSSSKATSMISSNLSSAVDPNAGYRVVMPDQVGRAANLDGRIVLHRKKLFSKDYQARTFVLQTKEHLQEPPTFQLPLNEVGLAHNDFFVTVHPKGMPLRSSSRSSKPAILLYMRMWIWTAPTPERAKWHRIQYGEHRLISDQDLVVSLYRGGPALTWVTPETMRQKSPKAKGKRTSGAFGSSAKQRPSSSLLSVDGV
ncbi:hypothetical protein BDP27DRAFT_1370258 [Rhodocollybia butyracea]|uniref:Uncharacterized protein n=1 Tax=Rhodocollybia butyracea TaxID=206335 RepID=A0A9P5PC61_9AGAR|nr:hypothetical protein BDP27DRAFT_1370258 [Rhodocollybia butyracea]